MRRLAWCIALLILFAGAAADSLFNIHDRVKTVLEGQFSRTLGRAVRIERLEGNLYQRIIMRQVVIAKGDSFDSGVLAKADTVEIRYSLKGALFDKFDVLAHVRQIRVIKPVVDLQRSRSGDWNFLPTANTASQKSPVQTNMIITLIDGRLDFTDNRGWAKQVSRFKTTITRLNTKIQLKNEHLLISTQGLIAGPQDLMPVATTLNYDLIAQRGNLKVIGQEVDLGFVNNYLKLPIKISGRGNLVISSYLAGQYSALDYAVQGEKIDISYQGYSGKNISGALNKQGDTLSIRFDQAIVGSGLVSGSVEVALNQKRLLPGTKVALSGVRLEEVLPSMRIPGAVTGSLQCSGPTDNTQLVLSFPKLELSTQNQVLSALIVSGNMQGQVTTYTAQFCLNNVWAQVTGTIAETWTASLTEQPLRMNYPQRENIRGTELWLTANGLAKFIPSQQRVLGELDILGRGVIAGETLSELSVKMQYLDNTLRVPEFRLALPNSTLIGQAVVTESYAINISEGVLDVRDSQWLQMILPDSTGKIYLTGTCTGRATWNAELSLRAEDLQHEDILLRLAEAKLQIKDTLYEIPSYHLDLDGNVFSGKALWQRVSTGKLLTMQDGRLKLELKTTRADLTLLDRFVKRIQDQSNAFSSRIEKLTTQNMTFPVLVLDPVAPLYAEYSPDKVQQYFQYAQVSTQNGILGTSLISGILAGTVRVSNEQGVLAIDADAQIRAGRTNYTSWDTLQCFIQTQGSTINLVASVKQLQVSPSVEIPEINLRATYADGLAMIEECQLYSGTAPPSSIVSGSFPVAALWDKSLYDTPFRLQIRATGDELNLLTPYLSGVTYISNAGVVDMVASGTYRSWQLSANTLQLKDLTVGLRNPYFQQIQVKKAQLKLTNNVLDIGACDVRFIGNQKTTPVFRLSGTIAAEKLSFINTEQLKLDTKLLLKDIDTEPIFIKNIYDGAVSFRNVSLVGKLNIPLSASEKDKQRQLVNTNAEEGPLLTGQIDLANGTLYLLAMDKDISVKTDKFISLRLDTELNIKNDVRVQTRDSILSGDINMLSQLNVGIRDNNPPIKISGTLNYYKVAGILYFDDGYVSVLNRTFTLLNKQEQSVYLKQSERYAGDNYLEFLETAKFTLDPHFSFAALTTVVDTVIASDNVSLASTEDVEVDTEVAEPVYTTIEKDYVLFIDGSVFELSSFRFQRYLKQNNTLVIDGDPYILKDASGRIIDNFRFKELAYDLSPSAVKAAWRASLGTAGSSWDTATKEMVRDLSATEINLLLRTMIRPVERRTAQILNLYDIKFKRDVGGKDVVSRLSFLQDTQTPLQTETNIGVSQELGVQLVKDLWRERLFLSLDTSLDRDLQTNTTQYLLYSWKITYRFLKDFSLYFVVVDEVNLNYGNEKDLILNTYIPVLSLDATHGF